HITGLHVDGGAGTALVEPPGEPVEGGQGGGDERRSGRDRKPLPRPSQGTGQSQCRGRVLDDRRRQPERRHGVVGKGSCLLVHHRGSAASAAQVGVTVAPVTSQRKRSSTVSRRRTRRAIPLWTKTTAGRRPAL